MATKPRKKVLVIGVGRFGAALIDELWDSGCDLIVVDKGRGRHRRDQEGGQEQGRRRVHRGRH